MVWNPNYKEWQKTKNRPNGSKSMLNDGVSPPRPAKYTDSFMPIFAKLLKDSPNVLDPMAGTGKLALIKNMGYVGKVICNEIEKEWVCDCYPVDEWHFGDAACMNWLDDNSISAVCTSPTYGNRMADHFNAKDTSRRMTYKHRLGRDLDERNTGRMQWGGEIQEQKHGSL